MFRDWEYQNLPQEAVHKRRPHKIAKSDPPSPLSAKCPHGSIPPPSLSVRTHHKFRKILKFFAPKSADVRIWRNPLPQCPRNIRTGQTPSPLTADVFMDGPQGCRITNFDLKTDLEVEALQRRFYLWYIHEGHYWGAYMPQ